MANIARVRVDWVGFSGGPGISTFYFDAASSYASAANPALSTFFAALKPYLPTTVTINFRTSADILDPATGDLVSSASITTGTSQGGTGSGNYAAASGFEVRWITADVVNSRRVAGRTYFVPAGPASFDNTGNLNSGTKAAVQTAASALLTSLGTGYMVWARPYKPTAAQLAKAAAEGKPAPVARAGSAHVVTSIGIPGKLVVLRSRRD
jgi:hypothetical protein